MPIDRPTGTKILDPSTCHLAAFAKAAAVFPDLSFEPGQVKTGCLRLAGVADSLALQLYSTMTSENDRLGAVMLSENIARLREEHGLTQKQLAEQLHVVRQTVSKWEKGTSMPDAETLVKLAEIFGTTPNELLDIETPQLLDVGELTWRTAVISEQLRVQQQRTEGVLDMVKRIFIFLMLVFVVLPFGAFTIAFIQQEIRVATQQPASSPADQTLIEYTLNGQGGQFAINYDPGDPSRPISYFGSEEIAQAVDAESYLGRSGTANQLEFAIYEYIEDHGGAITQVTPNY